MLDTISPYIVQIGRTTRGKVLISTVYLEANHNVIPGGCPIHFETMVFGGKYDGEQERYYTCEDAQEGHRKMVKKVFNEEVI